MTDIAALAGRIIAETGVVAVVRCTRSEDAEDVEVVCPDGTTPDQEAAVAAVVAAWPAEQARIDAVAAADAWFSGQLAAGYDTGLGWSLGLSSEDVTLLTGTFVLAKEAAALGLPLPAVIDTTGTPRHLDLPQLVGVMLGYGQHRAGLSEEYAARVAAA